MTQIRLLGMIPCLLMLVVGCGTTKGRGGTQQLILSDAVDRSVARLDFSPMRDRTVYLDATYIRAVKGEGFVNADYIISSLRQQVLASGCLLQESREDADIVIEARVGALGSDDHDLTFGIPANNTLATAASVVTPNAPPLPSIPEVSVAKRYDQLGAAKIAAFAYDRTTRRPLWQSGVDSSRSTARDYWVLGAGPFHHGSIYDGMDFAGGSKVKLPLITKNADGEETLQEDLDRYSDSIVFETNELKRVPAVVVVNHEEDAKPIEEAAEEAPKDDKKEEKKK